MTFVMASQNAFVTIDVVVVKESTKNVVGGSFYLR